MLFKVLNLLEKTLKQKGEIYKNDDVAFHCPVCNLESHKKKLIINLNENNDKFGYWRCWNCRDSNGMHGRNLIKLFRKIHATREITDELITALNSSIILKKSDNQDILPSNKNTNNINLPEEFISITNYQDTEAYKNAVNYLISRGITRNDIIKYNIGYCETGKYANRIIIPSYDSNAELNYFIARTFEKNVKPTYIKPSIKNDNIIFFDMHINWDEPVLFCEGVFDAIAAKRNAIPVLGNSIYNALLNKIIKEDVKQIVLALDMDMINTSIKYIEKFISNGIDVKYIQMKQKDPSELGFNEFIKLYNSSKSINFKNLITLKMTKSL